MFHLLKRGVMSLLNYDSKVNTMSKKENTQTEKSEPDNGFIGDELN